MSRMNQKDFIANFVAARLQPKPTQQNTNTGKRVKIVSVSFGSNDPYHVFLGKIGIIIKDEQAYVDVKFSDGRIGRFFTENSAKGGSEIAFV